MSVFVDTSAIYAILDVTDARHRAAGPAFADLLGAEQLLTHNYIVLESAALVQRRLGAKALRDLLSELIPQLSLHWVDEATHRAAVGALLSRPGTTSLVDRVSFEIMRQNRVRTAFAFDDDFRRNGFATVP